ncbi:MAG TPA: GNAT family N-acetyltransferase [Candidatus Angelobacter sp.]|nr:GNAT family N-acetyltransferase [Candidatus Angelobacter sp.]
MPAALAIVEVQTVAEIEAVRALFLAYRENLFSKCQMPDEEWQSLPGKYAPPDGGLLLAIVAGSPAGCVALRSFPQEHTCEMKRLYVLPGFRGHNVGRGLVTAVLDLGRRLGYQRMRLDTHPATMAAAVELYRQFGFVEVTPAPVLPAEGLMYMETQL